MEMLKKAINVLLLTYENRHAIMATVFLLIALTAVKTFITEIAPIPPYEITRGTCSNASSYYNTQERTHKHQVTVTYTVQGTIYRQGKTFSSNNEPPDYMLVRYNKHNPNIHTILRSGSMVLVPLECVVFLSLSLWIFLQGRKEKRQNQAKETLS